jgi:hypothetical protein
MKSAETAEAVVAAIESGRYDFIRTNFAGGDMVGHTADLPATRQALSGNRRRHRPNRQRYRGSTRLPGDHRRSRQRRGHGSNEIRMDFPSSAPTVECG